MILQGNPNLWTKPLDTLYFDRKRGIHNGNKGTLPYPDAKERKLLRQRIYNQRYYRRNRKQILAQKRKRRSNARK